MAHQILETRKGTIKAWISGVPLEAEARKQLENIAALPIVHHHVAVMPDVHLGIGATVGSVIPTIGAIVPAAVGVDIGCGMVASKTTLRAEDLPVSLKEMRALIEKGVPHGRSDNGGVRDKGAFGKLPELYRQSWNGLEPRYKAISAKHPRCGQGNAGNHLGTLGTGNHFVEVCLDEEGFVWVMLHSGSRGVGNRFGTYFIELAKKDMQHHIQALPDSDLSYFQEGSPHFDDYVEAVGWAQDFARENRRLMMEATLTAMRATPGLKPFEANTVAVNCHHNYVNREHHFGKDVWVTRKGAVSAKAGEMGIIPGSMGARSYIVRGKGNPESFHSCSHGAGRTMSRTQATKRFTVADHERATAGVECRKDAGVIDEIPMAYKSIEAVMAAQDDLVEVVYTLKQVLCVKG